MMSFILAGRDTTAVLIAWTLFELSQNSHVLERLVDEIDSVLGGRDPTYEDVRRSMPYLHVRSIGSHSIARLTVALRRW